MPDQSALAKYYESLTNAELLNLEREGGFTEVAERVFADELRRRKLDASDLKRYELQGARANLRKATTEKGGRTWGPGVLFFGGRYLDEDDRRANIQVRTKWFALGGIPLVPIASYRFKCSNDSSRRRSRDNKQRVIGRVPLDWTQVLLTWFETAIGLAFLILVLAGLIWYRNHGKL